MTHITDNPTNHVCCCTSSSEPMTHEDAQEIIRLLTQISKYIDHLKRKEEWEKLERDVKKRVELERQCKKRWAW